MARYENNESNFSKMHWVALSIFVIVMLFVVRIVSPSPPHLVQMVVWALNEGRYDKLVSLSTFTSEENAKKYLGGKNVPEYLKPGRIVSYKFDLETEKDRKRRIYRVTTTDPDGNTHEFLLRVQRLPTAWFVYFVGPQKEKSDMITL